MELLPGRGRTEPTADPPTIPAFFIVRPFRLPRTPSGLARLDVLGTDANASGQVQRTRGASAFRTLEQDQARTICPKPYSPLITPALASIHRIRPTGPAKACSKQPRE